MKNVRQLIERYEMLPPQGLVLVAVSGGMDSMCLLHYLRALGVRVAAAHFNHRLRGESSDADERFVRAYCAENGIACSVGSADVAALAKEQGWTLEEAGRRARYEFLERTAEELGAARIATAHHAGDSAETLLFHLARGTGADGFGIPPVRGCFIRPLLTTTRAEIADYVRAHGIPYRSDETNGDTAYTRNYIRHEILPLLTNVNPAAASHMAETALLLRGESAYLDTLAEERLAELKEEQAAVSLPAAAITNAPEALRPRMLRAMLGRLPVGKKDFTLVHFQALLQLACGHDNAQLDLPHGVNARRDAVVLTLACAAANKPERALLPTGAALVWGEYVIFARQEKNVPPPSADTLALDCAALDAPLFVDTWRASDRMTLAGTETPRSLKRLFSERGIAPAQRDALPVLRAGERAAAAWGVGVDAAFAPRGEKTLLVTVRKSEYK